MRQPERAKRTLSIGGNTWSPWLPTVPVQWPRPLTFPGLRPLEWADII
jgi:hypothetical protein